MPLPPSRASGPYRPTRLGSWEVIAKIAGGGMSAVYLGRHIDSPPDAPNVVALKIARHDTTMDDRLVKMFLEEGRLIQRLIHPNIVRTLEVGTDSDQDFIAMELMLGKTFAAVHDTLAARQVRMSAEIAAWTAARVADALEFAHQLADESGRPLSLVHRDVNPANVFATFRGEVKLFDFGLAKVTTGDTSSSHQMLAGKLSYLSPEQVMQIPVDRRSDIFSLGTTLWELLTGQRLFRRDNDIDTVRAVQLGPIPDIRTVAPELPEDLARIVRTALERNRDHRYPSAGYLARDLDQWLYQRTSPQEVTARLAQLVDTLFPGEQKRQGGWLKPAVSSAANHRAALAATMQSPQVPPSSRRMRPPGVEVRRESKEITAVMNLPPTHTPDGGVPAVQGPPGPLTPREGVPAVSSAPTTPRFAPSSVAPPASAPPRRPTQRMEIPTPPPISRTDIGIPQPPPPPPSVPPASVTAKTLPPDSPSVAEVERTIMTPSPSFPPPPRSPSFAPPPPQRASVPPPKATPSIPPKPIAARPPMRAPIPLPSKKGAIPLPSRASIPPKAPVPAPAPTPRADTKPPDSSKTQIDLPAPDRKS